MKRPDSDRTRFVAYITKYALTTGIEKAEVEDCFSFSPYMVSEAVSWGTRHHHKGEWYRTIEEAINKAEKMRLRKIASLKKSIEKFEKLDFRKTSP